jgi:glycosyltransferase involved in cell wall biosynthesis
VAKLAEEGMDIELLTVSKIPNREMPWYYSASDVMILCSNSEGSPTAVKEALACNLPVVSTNVGDVLEIMDGIAGVEVVKQTADALAGALKRVLYPTAGFVFNGRAAMERYSQSKTVEAILRVYCRVIARQDKAAAPSR